MGFLGFVKSLPFSFWLFSILLFFSLVFFYLTKPRPLLEGANPFPQKIKGKILWHNLFLGFLIGSLIVFSLLTLNLVFDYFTKQGIFFKMKPGDESKLPPAPHIINHNFPPIPKKK